MLIYAVGAAAHGMVIQYENIMPVHNQRGKLHAEANQIKFKMHDLRRTTFVHLWIRCPSAEKEQYNIKQNILTKITRTNIW